MQQNGGNLEGAFKLLPFRIVFNLFYCCLLNETFTFFECTFTRAGNRVFTCILAVLLFLISLGQTSAKGSRAAVLAAVTRLGIGLNELPVQRI